MEGHRLGIARVVNGKADVTHQRRPVAHLLPPAQQHAQLTLIIAITCNSIGIDVLSFWRPLVAGNLGGVADANTFTYEESACSRWRQRSSRRTKTAQHAFT